MVPGQLVKNRLVRKRVRHKAGSIDSSTTEREKMKKKRIGTGLQGEELKKDKIRWQISISD